MESSNRLIAGVGLAGTARKSRWPARLDLVQSGTGLVLALFSALIMPPLARAKRRVAETLGSGALAAEAQQTMLCSYLSWILLLGLAMNALFGWWWADPLAALAMVPIIGREGWEALRGRSSCACHVHTHTH